VFDPELYQTVRQEFAAHLRFNRGYSKTTCYNYNSDLGIWGNWLQARDRDWQQASIADVEQFIIWHLQDRGLSVPIVMRRLGTLSTFYRWALKHEIVERDPVYLADKPKRPQRLPVWLGREEQKALEASLADTDDLPDNIFGQKPEHVRLIRQRYEMLFLLLLNAGLRISEALTLKVEDVRVSEGVARFLRVIGKGNKERLLPLPAPFGKKFAGWLAGKPGNEFVFAQQPGGKPPGPESARSYLRRLKARAGITKPITPHKLRHTYATNLLNAGAELVDIQALLGHVNLGTTQIYAHVSEDRMQAVVAKLAKL
jgi:integrase/recombinase XerD